MDDLYKQLLALNESQQVNEQEEDELDEDEELEGDEVVVDEDEDEDTSEEPRDEPPLPREGGEEDDIEEPKEDAEDEDQEDPEKQYFGKGANGDYYYLNKKDDGWYVSDAAGKIVFPKGEGDATSVPTDIVDFLSVAQKELEMMEMSTDLFTRYIEPALAKEEKKRDEEAGFTFEDELDEEDKDEDEIPEVGEDEEKEKEKDSFDFQEDEEKTIAHESKVDEALDDVFKPVPKEEVVKRKEDFLLKLFGDKLKKWDEEGKTLPKVYFNSKLFEDSVNGRLITFVTKGQLSPRLIGFLKDYGLDYDSEKWPDVAELKLDSSDKVEPDLICDWFECEDNDFKKMLSALSKGRTYAVITNEYDVGFGTTPKDALIARVNAAEDERGDDLEDEEMNEAKLFDFGMYYSEVGDQLGVEAGVDITAGASSPEIYDFIETCFKEGKSVDACAELVYDKFDFEELEEMNETILKEGVQELIHEVPDIEEDDKAALTWGLETKLIPNEFPSVQVMVDGLLEMYNDVPDKAWELLSRYQDAKVEGNEDLANEIAGELKVMYLQEVILPKVYVAYEKKDMEESKELTDEVLTFDQRKPMLVSGITEDADYEQAVEEKEEGNEDHPQTIFESLHKRLFEVDDWWKRGSDEEEDEVEEEVVDEEEEFVQRKKRYMGEGKNAPGKQDGTGPYKNAKQRRLTGAKGKRKLSGKKCKFESRNLNESPEGVSGDIWVCLAQRDRYEEPLLETFVVALKELINASMGQITSLHEDERDWLPDEDELQEVVKALENGRSIWTHVPDGGAIVGFAFTKVNAQGEAYKGLVGKEIENENDLENYEFFESILTETVQELIHEVSGITKYEKAALEWAIQNKKIADDFPSDEEMREDLRGMKDATTLDSSELKIAYLRYYLAPLAYEMENEGDVEESKINEVRFELNNIEFNVELVEDREDGVTISINDKQTFEFSSDFANLFREGGELSEDALTELGRTALSNLSEEFFNELAYSNEEEAVEEPTDIPVDETDVVEATTRDVDKLDKTRLIELIKDSNKKQEVEDQLGCSLEKADAKDLRDIVSGLSKASEGKEKSRMWKPRKRLTEKHWRYELELPIQEYMDADEYNEDLSETEVQIASKLVISALYSFLDTKCKDEDAASELSKVIDEFEMVGTDVEQFNEALEVLYDVADDADIWVLFTPNKSTESPKEDNDVDKDDEFVDESINEKNKSDRFHVCIWAGEGRPGAEGSYRPTKNSCEWETVTMDDLTTVHKFSTHKLDIDEITPEQEQIEYWFNSSRDISKTIRSLQQGNAIAGTDSFGEGYVGFGRTKQEAFQKVVELFKKESRYMDESIIPDDKDNEETKIKKLTEQEVQDDGLFKTMMDHFNN